MSWWMMVCGWLLAGLSWWWPPSFRIPAKPIPNSAEPASAQIDGANSHHLTKDFAGDYPVDTGLLLDLAQSGLNAGLSVPQIVKALGQAAGLEGLVHTSRALLLGVDWQTAWALAADTDRGGTDQRFAKGSSARMRTGSDAGIAGATVAGTSARQTRVTGKARQLIQRFLFGSAETREYLDVLQNALEPAWSDGVDPQPLLRSAASRFRQQRSQKAKQAAQKLSIRLVLPLGLCQLPAFILLGLVPTVLGGIHLL